MGRSFQEKIRNIPAKWISSIAFALLFLRAWPRLLSPQVWDEDGTLNLYGYLTAGFADLSRLINGYLAVISKLISILAVSVSFTLYPLISTLLAWALTIFAFVVVAKAPLRLKGGVLLASLCMLIPSDPEVFGLPLYATWWAALLMFAAAFWDENSGHSYFRLLAIVLASLSSPFCLVTLPVFWARAVMFKGNLREKWLAIAASAAAGIQLWAMWPITSHAELPLRALPEIVPVFLGNYAVGNLYPALTEVLGLLIFAYILAGLVRNKSDWVLWALCYLWIASVFISISRITIFHLHPVYAGPRYFFFPFVLLGWIILQIILGRSRTHIRAVGAGLLVMSVINALPCLTRKHDDLNWRGHISSCVHFSDYSFPVHFDGNGTNVWYFSLKGRRCADLLRRDAFSFLARGESYPYTVIEGLSEEEQANINAPGARRIADGERRERDFRPVLSDEWDGRTGYEMIGRFSVEKSSAGGISIRLRRGQRILLRARPESAPKRMTISGYAGTFYDSVPPAPQWTVLEYSSRLLPEEFILEIE